MLIFVMQFSAASYPLTILLLNAFLSFSYMSSLSVRDQVSCLFIVTDIVMVLYILFILSKQL